MDQKTIAAILDEMGTLFEIKGENPFKCRAYHNASRIIETLTDNLEDLARSGNLKTIKGIGQGLSSIISELVLTGKSDSYESLKSSLPAGLLEMTRIQGLGPKRIRILYEKLKITSIANLKKACENHRLSELDGFGDKIEQNFLKGVEHLGRVSDKHLYSKAKEAADQMLEALMTLKEIKRCDVAGSLRRKKEIIGDIDILVSAADKNRRRIFETFISHPLVESVIARGDTKTSVVLTGGVNCDMRIVKDVEYPFALNYFTGSKEHNVEMRSRARQLGWSLNEYAFSKIGNGTKAKRIPSCHDEESIYHALRLSYIPPELRENAGEFDSAMKGRIPKLIEDSDVKGTFHCHTTDSDGTNSLEAIVAGAQKLGWKYLGIADHSKVAVYANGLSVERVKAQMKAIDALNARLNDFKVFKGTEVDILPDGSLDYPDRLLSMFDYVVASIHSKFKMTKSEATRRVVKALKNKYVTMLGHPTGRLLLSREGYPLDLQTVIDSTADYGKSIEINAHPMRLDLDWRYVKYAKEKGVPICINPDAHSISGLEDVRYGVGIARKGWLEAKNVINAWSTKQVTKFFDRIRG